MSNSEAAQRIVITGSSSGFGLLTTKSLLTLGYEVVATMRDSTTRNASKAADLRAFSADTSGELTVVELDVTSDTSVASAAEEIRELGHVDVLVNDAARADAAKALHFYDQFPSNQKIMAREGVTHAADLAVIGDPDAVIGQLLRYRAAGATDIVLSPLQTEPSALPWVWAVAAEL